MPCTCALIAYMGLTQMLGSVPARTVGFQVDAWENKSWGFHNIDRRTIAGTVAVSGDGSRHSKLSAIFYRYFLIAKGDDEMETIYRRADRAAYRFDDGGNVITVLQCPCSWDID